MIWGPDSSLRGSPVIPQTGSASTQRAISGPVFYQVTFSQRHMVSIPFVRGGRKNSPLPGKEGQPSNVGCLPWWRGLQGSLGL